MLKEKLKTSAILIILMLTVFSLTGCGTQKVSLDDCVLVNVTGYSGYANATLTVDSVYLDYKVEQEKISKYLSSISNGTYTENLGFGDLLNFEILNPNYLSNGDTVTVLVNVSDDLSNMGETLDSLQEGLKISLPSNSIEVQVSYLPEAQVIDVMSFVENYVVYDGADGGATATIKFPKDFTYEIDGFVLATGKNSDQLKIIKDYTAIKEITYVCEYDGYLSEGQTFNVVINDSDVTVGNTGYIINTKKECSVTGLPKYISSKDELTPELKNAIDEAITKTFRGGGREWIIGYYWGTIKPSTETDNLARDYNRIFIVYAGKDMMYEDYYKMRKLREVIKMPDGTYHVETFGADSTRIASEFPESNKYDLEIIEW